jgi:hypothetical protein
MTPFGQPGEADQRIDAQQALPAPEHREALPSSQVEDLREYEHDRMRQTMEAGATAA